MRPEQIEELAALHAVGALDGAERDDFERLLQGGDEHARRTLREFQQAAALMATASVPTTSPPPAALKQKILDRVGNSRRESPATAPTAGALPATLAAGFQFVPNEPSIGWVPMRAPGSFAKLLSFNRDSGYAVVLGKLDPGARYPAHFHSGAEEIYLLTGDLKIGGRVLRAGDFHHADAGTSHGENCSEQGCTLLAVICSRDVLQEMGVY